MQHYSYLYSPSHRHYTLTLTCCSIWLDGAAGAWSCAKLRMDHYTALWLSVTAVCRLQCTGTTLYTIVLVCGNWNESYKLLRTTSSEAKIDLRLYYILFVLFVFFPIYSNQYICLFRHTHSPAAHQVHTLLIVLH